MAIDITQCNGLYLSGIAAHAQPTVQLKSQPSLQTTSRGGDKQIRLRTNLFNTVLGEPKVLRTRRLGGAVDVRPTGPFAQQFGRSSDEQKQ
ncbi:uncharacterized protein VTP21DRAFT_6031 [Calcarisporiella thermophila]|uniref:uncharacterized protein n=1 Tax=Calcarisporiella thermophila TaxID=911321 RepID=UPI0037425101